MVGGQPVGLEGLHFPLGGDHALARHDGAQRGDDALAPRQHRAVQLGHPHRHGGKLPAICSGHNDISHLTVDT